MRLQVLKATLTGTVIRPDDDYPEMRNPKHWTLSNDAFVVAPESTPVEAIADLWVVHENDGVPIPRIRCYKYSSLVLIEGYIQYFRETGNAAGLAALNRLIGHRTIPQGLPNGGDDLLWKRRLRQRPSAAGRPGVVRQSVLRARPGTDSPGGLSTSDSRRQVARRGGRCGRRVHRIVDRRRRGKQRLLPRRRKVHSRRKLPFAAMSRFVSAADNENATAHEQVLTPKIFTLTRFQEHMVDDNYTAQACMRASPGTVRPEDFKIERVRSPIGPENLLRLYAGSAASKPLEGLIDAMASRNKPPRLVTVGDATVPLFGADYDWSEQQRVRTAIDAVMRTKSDDFWWRLRASIRDDRYVLTATRGGVAKNFTLGAICCDIVDSRLCLGFTAHLPSVPGRLPASFRPEQEYWQHEAQWARQRTPLYAMQAALCERAIQQWETVQGTLPGSDGQAHVYTADEKARYVAALKKEIAERNQTKKAAYEEVVVPWLPAPGGWEGFDAERAQEVRAEYDSKRLNAN